MPCVRLPAIEMELALLLAFAPPSKEVRVRCPVCDAAESVVAHTGTLVLGPEDVFQKTRVCLGCGLTFEDSNPDYDWTSLYGTVWQRGTSSESYHDSLYDEDARVIGEGHGMRAYDVGCGAGFLLDRLALQGWFTAGCDPEERVARVARKKGHEVQTGLFQKQESGRAELVILGDVLEHQPRPLEMLETARAWLAHEEGGGGQLHVRVPDLERVNFDTFGDVFGLQHRVWFTSATLRTTLARAGFRVTRLAQRGAGLMATAVCDVACIEERPYGEPEASIAMVEAYSRDIRERRDRISERIKGLAGKNVALWGGGEHASELMKFTSLGALASRVVDKNPGLWDRLCAGHAIEPPQSLFEDPPEAVVIASKAYQDSIATELAPLVERGVKVVQLYERGGRS